MSSRPCNRKAQPIYSVYLSQVGTEQDHVFDIVELGRGAIAIRVGLRRALCRSNGRGVCVGFL